MEHRKTTKSLFAGKGVSFDKIALHNELGGLKAISNYLEIRHQQLARNLKHSNVNKDDEDRLIKILDAFDAGRQFLNPERLNQSTNSSTVNGITK